MPTITVKDGTKSITKTGAQDNPSYSVTAGR